MSSDPAEPDDLLDLKLLPAWMKEPAGAYAHYEGEDQEQRPRRDAGGGREERRPQARDRRPPRGDNRGPKRPSGKPERGKDRQRPERPAHDRRGRENRPQVHEAAAKAIADQITVRFLAQPPALEKVIAQIKSNPVAYSVFALARLFLEKPERYDVQLTAKPEAALYRLGENPAVSVDQQFLESSAFRIAQRDFYSIEVVQSEPVKGNFSTVARCRASGTLLGPTNHHAYQPKLRNLYEQRFSRRMSFPEYQRQIEIVNDAAIVEQWKEEARNVTTFTTLKEETPATFTNATEVERHFRQNYLPGLVRSLPEQTISGVTSRHLPDRHLHGFIEDAWSKETRSPSQMMQELSQKFREASLQIFRHRRGMLFVTSVRTRPFSHDQTGVSAQIQAILQAIAATAGINRKDLANKVLMDVPGEEAEARKLALASDLRWLISEGYVIEFNDGSLDLPRVKAKAAEEKAPGDAEQKPSEQSEEVAAPVAAATGEPEKQVPFAADTSTTAAPDSTTSTDQADGGRGSGEAAGGSASPRAMVEHGPDTSGQT